MPFRDRREAGRRLAERLSGLRASSPLVLGLPRVLREHVVEGAYAAPEYLGNRDLAGWAAIGFPGDVQPRGYTDAEVEGRA